MKAAHFPILRLLLCIPLLLWCAQTPAPGQTGQTSSRTVSGTVRDGAGDPVVGAGVTWNDAQGRPKGGITDLGGRFSLQVPSSVRSLNVSALTFRPAAVALPPGAAEGLDIVLQPEENTLDQVVITGYAQTTTKKITGSVGVLGEETFRATPVPTVDALIQGEIAGVSVKATSGQPGTQAKIRIRGTNNLSGQSDPLWVVDGVPLQNESPSLSAEQLATGGFDDIFVSGIGGINPHDIESVTILKDAAAAAIYGSRAANGVIVVTTKRGESGRMRVNYSNSFSWSFHPQRSVNLMNSAEKIAWEQTLWEEFSAPGYELSKTNPGTVFPVIGVVGQVRAGLGPFAPMKDDAAAQDAYLAALSKKSTDWYGLLFRNAFSQNHHLSLSGGADRYTYYISLGFNDDDGMLIHNNYRRYNVSAKLMMRPVDRLKLDIGLETARQRSKNPDSSVNPFTYAYFANPYEKPYDSDGGYAADNTWFNLGYYNGRAGETVIPDKGFNILNELDHNSTTTVNQANTLRGQADVTIWEPLHFIGLASWSFSNNSTDKIVERSTYSAFRDRLGNDDKSQTNLYGNIAQNRTDRNSYVVRGHFAFNRRFGKEHTVNALAGAELRGASSNTLFSKRYHYDAVTGTSSLPAISGDTDQWLSQVERLNGQYFTESRYASFYASADWFWRTLVLNASFRTDGSSYFGSKRQFNPTWSAGAAWHLGDEKWMKRALPFLSHATLRAAYGFTGDVNRSTSHLLVMQYLLQQYRYYGSEAYMLGTIPSAPNPNLGWEKTRDMKAGLDFGLWKDRLTLAVEGYYRLSTDVVTSSRVASVTGFTSVYFNSADLMNSGIEATLGGKAVKTRDWELGASVNFAYNFNKVRSYKPYSATITSKDRYVEGYPVGAIIAGDWGGIDRSTGLYKFRLREDAVITKPADLNNPENYRRYLGTTIAPFTGGFHLSLSWKMLRLSVSGVYSFGNKVYEKIVSPASYLNARRAGVTPEPVQSQYSDLYANHLNVTRDRTDRWTETKRTGVTYPRIYDYYGTHYGFSVDNPMDFSIIDAIYLKDVSYLRLKSVILSCNMPDALLKKLRLSSMSVHCSLQNFLTITGYDGMDPEIPGATYPTTRSVSFGINLGF